MPMVEFTAHLRRFFPGLESLQVDGATVAEVIAGLDAQHPGLAHYIVDERGTLRKHVNIFVDGKMVRDRTALSDPVEAATTVTVFQALSGG